MFFWHKDVISGALCCKKREVGFLASVTFVGNLKMVEMAKLCRYFTNCHSLFKPHIVIAVAFSLSDGLFAHLLVLLLWKIKLFLFC